MFNRERLRSFIHGRKYAYHRTFESPHGQEVLADLAQFCRAVESTFHQDPRVAANLDGRREVFLRIQQHLGLSPDDLFKLVTGQAQSDKQTLAEPREE